MDGIVVDGIAVDGIAVDGIVDGIVAGVGCVLSLYSDFNH